MKGGVYSACGEMKETVPPRSPGQWSHWNCTWSPTCTRMNSVSGMKKRTKMFSAGRSETTGAPARQRLSRPRDYVRDDGAHRRGDRPLVEPPLRLLERGLQRIDQRILRLDFARPAHRRLAVASAAVAAATLASAERRSASS